jgi:hypothetical protein
MGQRNKQQAKAAGKKLDVKSADAPSGAVPTTHVHPPAKNPALLGLSIVLFLAWFVFLLVAALGG